MRADRGAPARRTPAEREETDMTDVQGNPLGRAAAPAQDATLPDFLAWHATGNAERAAIRELRSGAVLGYAELDHRVRQCMTALLGWLSHPFGKRVAMLSRNSLDLVTLHYACARLGAVFVPLNWRLTGNELRILVEDAGPELLVCEEEFRDAGAEAIRGSTVHTVLSAGPDGNELAGAIDAAEPIRHRPQVPADAPVTLLYTSGTTGRPKGVIWTRQGAWYCELNFTFASGVSPGDVFLCDVPMFHVSGLCAMTRGAICSGSTLIVSDRFTPANALALLSDPGTGATHYFAVPQMAQAMRAEPLFARADLRRLKALVVGGGPVPRALVEQYLAEGVPLVDGYGLSEAGTVFGMPLDSATMVRKAGTSGVAAPWIQVRLVDRAGNDVPDGEVGEIWLRGPSVTPGYWQRPEATAEAITDGWVHTGDAAVRDRDGFYRLVDRWKDMYISGGENVYPAEVEAVLLEISAVAEAAVVGVPDERWGESGCAWVVPADPAAAAADPQALAEEIRSGCRERLARYKVPREVRFTDALPRTGSGKVRKPLLRQAHAEGKPPLA